MNHDTVHTAQVPFEIQSHQHEEDEMISCFIPAINTYFSVRKFSDIEEKANALIKIWVNHFNEENKMKIA